MKNKFLIVVLIAAMFVLAACGGQAAPTSNSGGAQPAQNTPSTGGQMPSGMSMSVSKNIMLDPAMMAGDTDSQTVMGYMYETLIKIQDGAPVPGLAASAAPAEDGLAYTITLRPGVKFHDGTAVNADAVIANFNRWFDPKDAGRGSGTYDAWAAAFKGFKGETGADGKAKSTFDGAEKVDDLTVILHLNTPDPDFLTKLANPAFSIVSPAAFGMVGFGTMTGKDGGTGPYMMSAWTASGLTLAPFADYWNPSAAASGNLDFSLSK